MRPLLGAIFGCAANEFSLTAKGVDALTIDKRSGPGARRIGHGVRGIVGFFPDHFAGACIETKKAFVPLLVSGARALGFRFGSVERLAVHDENTITGDRWSGIATVDGCAPENLGAATWKLVDNPGLPPNSVVLWAEPLRPVVCNGRDRESNKEE